MATPLDRIIARSDDGGRGALRFIRVYLKNAIQFPNHPSFSTINPSNEQFHKKVGSIDGSMEFLIECGFKQQPDGMLVMKEEEAEGIAASLARLVDALAQVEAAINAVADPNLYLHVHELKLDRTSNELLTIKDTLYMQLRCDLVGSTSGLSVENHKTAEHPASKSKWKERLTLGGTIGVCVHIALYKKRKLLPDLAVAHGMFSFPGGQDDPVMAWVPLTTQVGNRGLKIGSTKIEVDSESLKMLRAEQIDKEAGKQFQQRTKEELQKEGRMPEAPDLVAAGVAEEGYVPHKPEHSSATAAGGASLIPPAFQHKKPAQPAVAPAPEEKKPAEPEAEKAPEPEPEAQTAPEPEAQKVPEPEPEPEAEKAPEPEPEAQTAPEPEAQKVPEPEPEPEAEKAPEPEPEAEKVPEPEPEAEKAPEAQTAPEPEVQKVPEPEPAPEAEKAPEPEPEQEQEPRPVAEDGKDAADAPDGAEEPPAVHVDPTALAPDSPVKSPSMHRE
eukprot:TRINITY_DN4975_c0_g1_i5.p1 TRINITY_DN4975_c0_g1~~TRINITY_DN4975_c0_g1_i5.p1  ORF type:complete len:499 (+),score=174.04 TRINITY_DN4975_c0_g1_i5:67-1563(+)